MSNRAKTVMGFGTFDGVHPGHLFYLGEIKKLGEKLIIVIARDENVLKIKGKAPFFKQEERLEQVEKTHLADLVVLGNKTDFYQVIREFNPDVLGIGYDQKANEQALKVLFPKIKIIRVSSHKAEQYKSSLLNQLKLRNVFNDEPSLT